MLTFFDMLLDPQRSIHILHSLFSVPVIQTSPPPHKHSIYKAFHHYLIAFWAYLLYSAGPTQKQFFLPRCMELLCILEYQILNVSQRRFKFLQCILRGKSVALKDEYSYYSGAALFLLKDCLFTLS